MVINRLPDSKLLKLEVPELAENVIGIVTKHDPEVLQIEPVFNLLLAKQSEISKLKAPYGVDPIRLELKLLREKLMLDVSAIKLHLKRLYKTTDKNELQLIQTVMNRYFAYLYKSRNIKEVKQKITGFLDDVKSDVELSTALSKFDFTDLVSNLGVSLFDVREVSSKRVSKLSQRPADRTQDLTTTVLDSIEYVFKEIEVAQLRNPDLDYAPLVNELNVLLYKYRLTIDIRANNNSRKAAAQKGYDTRSGVENNSETNAPKATSTEVLVTPTTNGNGTYQASEVKDDSISIKNMNSLMMEKKSENGSNEDSDLKLDKKETAATSSKALQLSQVCDDKNALK